LLLAGERVDHQVPYRGHVAGRGFGELLPPLRGELGHPVSVTVVDRDGIVIVQQRADTATGATVQVSLSKAVAAVGFQMPTSAIQDYAKTNPGAIYIQGFSILPGGLPISLDGSVVAGIGVSGAPTGEIDASCAADGINAIS
jgi:uncharacterized protein GlcG (DUF336 family)